MNEVLNTEEIVSAYLAIRAERERILREYEVADTALKSDMSRLEAVLLEACNAVNADSIKTTYGTVMRKLNERAYCTDWDSFRKFDWNTLTMIFERSASIRVTSRPSLKIMRIRGFLPAFL